VKPRGPASSLPYAHRHQAAAPRSGALPVAAVDAAVGWSVDLRANSTRSFRSWAISAEFLAVTPAERFAGERGPDRLSPGRAMRPFGKLALIRIKFDPANNPHIEDIS